MADPELDLVASVFQTEQARAALEKYAAVTKLTVRVYGRNGRTIAATTGSNPLFELVTSGREPSIQHECVKGCLAQGEATALVVEDGHGLAIVGVPLTNDGEVVGVATAGYVLTSHLDQREIQRLARDHQLSFQSVWDVVRRQLPTPIQRLPLYGELLRVIGDTLLGEHSRSRQLQATLTRLEEADRSKDEFLAILSHELRTPLTSILGWVQMLRTKPLDAGVSSHALETIERNVNAQTKLVNDLLDVSRIVTSTLSLALERVDLIPVLQGVVDAVRVVADAKGIRLETVLDPSVGSMSADPQRLRQIFSNVLSNAVKFTPSGGSVTIRLERVDADAVVIVRDTGQGMSPDFLPHIFERFKQADSTITRAQGGLGLGLAIVQHLVALHGGTVRGDSQGPDQGSTFTVTLPLSKDVPLEGAAEPHRARGASPPALRGTRILLVDDNDDTREMLRIVLALGGAQVTVAASADDALAILLTESRPDVLVCDIGMPGMDGYDLLRHVRRLGAEHGGRIPAIALTGHASAQDRDRARAAGFQAHLAKPVQPDDLLAAIVMELNGRLESTGCAQ